ncbi:MAG: SCO family protein [Bauldia sp.]|nr:SCO family protein [Bauldia sp.]MCW5717385.1 SCO family protein [Bauldia sp.]
MTRLQMIRYTIWGAAAVILLVFAFVFWRQNNAAETADNAVVTIGGPFTLTADDGTTVTEAALQGQPTLMFFGFTHCPDVCPTALAEVGTWLDALGPDADRLNVFLVTVDPERDTVPVMAQYLSVFDPQITGLTGTPEQIDAMLSEFHVYSEKIAVDSGDYTMNHTAAFFLFDANGRFADVIDYHDGLDAAVADIRAVLNG